MPSLRGLPFSVGLVLLAAACSDAAGPDPRKPATAECSDASLLNLAAGQYKIIDPEVEGSCIRVPAAGSSGAQYLYAALATEGTESSVGVAGDYQLDGGAAGSALGDVATARGAVPDPTFAAFRPPLNAVEFHNRLRRRDRALADGPQASFRFGAQPAISATITRPTVGQQRSFFVCGTADCNANEFVQTTATVKHVGQRVAIYVDDSSPPAAQGGYSQGDLDRVGALFDSYLYPIDTTAFGRESDVDSNGVVIVLLTQHVNALSGDCANSVILGYFFGGVDLDLTDPNSNRGEVFYGIVPDPNSSSCPISTDYANLNLPPTFIHEFQHMISFNQHKLVRSSSQEDLWLNEGLSHYAEELGGWQIPDAQCVNSDCLTQFAVGDLVNGYNYLHDPESNYLIAPANSGASLEERGAAWLFLRWLVDHYGSDKLGRNVTRPLVQTSRTGADNVQHVVNEPFANLVSLWQLANYLDNLSGFTSSSAAFQYSTWNFRDVFSSFHSQQPSKFPTAYPLVPDQVIASGYSHAGVLRAGSGQHVLITQPASGEAVDLRLTASDGTSLPPATVKPRIAIVRIR